VQGTRKALKWLLVGLIICLTSSSLIKTTFNAYTFTHKTELNESTKSSTPESPSNENLSPNILDYPPYLQRFKGRTPIYGVQASKDNDRIYYTHSSYGIGCYFPENDTYKTLSFENPISETADGNIINDFALDENQSKLYVGSWIGLIVVDLSDWSYEIRNFSDDYFINEIRALHFDEQDQMLFIGTDKGMRVFFTNNQTFLDTAKLPSSIRTSGIKDIAYNYETNELYVAKSDELFHYNFTSKILTTIYEPPNFLFSIDSNFENDLIFLGCNGLIIFNLTNNQEIAHYGAHPDPDYDFVTDHLIFDPGFGGIVFGSIGNWDKGAFVVNVTAETINYLNISNGLLHDFVSSFEPYIDNSTGIPKEYMLIATKGGFNYYDYESNSVSKTKLLDKDLPSNRASCLSLNEELNQLYIGSGLDNYLSVLDLNSTTNIINYDHTNGLPDTFLGYAHYYSKNNSIFINTWEGLVLFNLTSNETIRTFTTADGLLDHSIQAMLLAEDLGYLFIATINGFNILDLDTLEFESYFEGSNCYSMILDLAQEKLYVGVSNHVKVLSLSSMLITSISLPLDSLCCYDIELFEEKNIAFIGTQYGLYILDLQKSVFIKHYHSDNSPLTNNYIHQGMHFNSAKGNLIISNLDVTIFNFEHDFWFNLNEAALVDEGLYLELTESLVYSNDKLYLGTFSSGLFIIDHIDEDQDELYDCYEVWLFGTDPAMNDTDCDGFTDAEELWVGTDPLDPNSYPVPPIPEPNNLRYLWFLTIISVPVTTIIVIVTRRKQKK